jgi:hypothetical protein
MNKSEFLLKLPQNFQRQWMPMATGRAELLGAKKKDLGDDFSES